MQTTSMQPNRSFITRAKKWLAHAFAVRGDEADAPTELEESVADSICREITVRKLTTPALVFLESVRPLNYVSSQLMHFFSPLVACLCQPQKYDAFARFLERRESVDYLCRRLEELDDSSFTSDKRDASDGV